MAAFLAEYGVTILLAAILGGLLFLAIRYMVRRRRKGGCHGCAGCAHEDSCVKRETGHKPHR